ncbi:MAG TPA: hypothetical protein VN284_03505, partial [Rhizobium sp.]|nr:hypothetical protein [Rhizobium sp.]
IATRFKGWFKISPKEKAGGWVHPALKGLGQRKGAAQGGELLEKGRSERSMFFVQRLYLFTFAPER